MSSESLPIAQPITEDKTSQSQDGLKADGPKGPKVESTFINE